MTLIPGLTFSLVTSQVFAAALPLSLGTGPGPGVGASSICLQGTLFKRGLFIKLECATLWPYGALLAIVEALKIREKANLSERIDRNWYFLVLGEKQDMDDSKI